MSWNKVEDETWSDDVSEHIIFNSVFGDGLNRVRFEGGDGGTKVFINDMEMGCVLSYEVCIDGCFPQIKLSLGLKRIDREKTVSPKYENSLAQV